MCCMGKFSPSSRSRAIFGSDAFQLLVHSGHGQTYSHLSKGTSLMAMGAQEHRWSAPLHITFTRERSKTFNLKKNTLKCENLDRREIKYNFLLSERYFMGFYFRYSNGRSPLVSRRNCQKLTRIFVVRLGLNCLDLFVFQQLARKILPMSLVIFLPFAQFNLNFSLLLLLLVPSKILTVWEERDILMTHILDSYQPENPLPYSKIQRSLLKTVIRL